MWQCYPKKQKLWHPFYDNVSCAASYHIKSGSHRGIADMHGYDPVTVKLTPYFMPNRFLHDLLHSAEFWLAFIEWNICSPMIKVIFFLHACYPRFNHKKRPISNYLELIVSVFFMFLLLLYLNCLLPTMPLFSILGKKLDFFSSLPFPLSPQQGRIHEYWTDQ